MRQIVSSLVVIFAPPVLPWQPENKARFIISKLNTGYDADTLQSELGFEQQDIQEAKKIMAINRMTHALDLPDSLKKRIESPRSKITSTINRVFGSSAGQKFLKIRPSPKYGIVGSTTRQQFMRAFKLLVEDIASGRENSRTLNTNEDITKYFQQRKPQAVAKGRGRFVPEDITPPSPDTVPASSQRPKQKKIHQTVIPSSLKVVCTDNERIKEIRKELTKLRREKFPNAGAALLRVFFELTVKNYLIRIGKLQVMEAKQKEKGRLPQNWPSLRILTKAVLPIAKKKLPQAQQQKIEKALKHDRAAPFTIDGLHAFMHTDDFPGSRDILQFWNRTESLFRLMLEKEPEDSGSNQ